MRVALVTPGFSSGPDDWAIPALLNLARGLADQVELHVFSQRYPSSGQYRFDGLAHTALGGGQRFGPASVRTWLATSLALVRQHRRTPFDVLHAFWADEAGFAAGLAGAVVGRPVVVSLGGGELTRLPAIHYGAQRFLARRLTTAWTLRQARLVTAGSAYELDLARVFGVLKSRLCPAPLGVDTDLFRPGGGASPVPTLVQAASLLPVKNQAMLLEVFHLVRRVLPACRLHLAGTGPEQARLAGLAQRLDLAAAITWHGVLPYLQMPTFYRQAHLYLQTSLHESQGMAVLEAMACGLPVLGTPVGVVRELAARPASFSPPALAGQAVEILNDPAGLARLSEQARRAIEPAFSLPATTAFFLELYQQLI